jgi:hypothetical protein
LKTTLALHRTIDRGGRPVRPGLLGITDYVRIRTSQESTWIFLFWLQCQNLIQFRSET